MSECNRTKIQYIRVFVIVCVICRLVGWSSVDVLVLLSGLSNSSGSAKGYVLPFMLLFLQFLGYAWTYDVGVGLALRGCNHKKDYYILARRSYLGEPSERHR